MQEINLALALIGTVVIALGFFSDLIKRGPVSEPLIAVAAGVLIGPLGLNLMRMDAWDDPIRIIEIAARFTLAISIMGVALRLDRAMLRIIAWPTVLLLTLGMIGMWVLGSLVGWAVLGLSVWTALLIGAVVSPTDPVVASAIVTGSIAQKHLSERLRDTLSAESGANDGLAYLFVTLPLFILLPAADATWRTWIVDALLLGVLWGVVLGAAVGYGAALLLRFAERHHMMGRHSLLTTTVSVSLVTLGAGELLGADALLSVFAAGVVFNLVADREEEMQDADVQEAMAKLFTRPVFVLFGIALPWAAWAEEPWMFLLFGIGLLLIRRPPVLALLIPWLRPKYSMADIAFLGWFGPIGIAAVYYATYAVRVTGDMTIWHATAAAVLASIVIHGITASPLTRLHPVPAKEG